MRRGADPIVDVGDITLGSQMIAASLSLPPAS
jgi:hypothetical protein